MLEVDLLKKENSMSLPRANKNLGQHFLKDQSVINKICNDFSDEAQLIYEVGPGPGILTKHLTNHELPFEVFEKDDRFPELLADWVKPEDIHLCDATTIDFQKHQDESIHKGKKTWLVSNLPYNVGVPLLMNFIRSPNIKYMTLMLQKEVGLKIRPDTNKKKFKDMSSLMALTQNYFDVKTLCLVPPGAFIPPPKVDSIVISLKRLESPVIALEQIDSYLSLIHI